MLRKLSRQGTNTAILAHWPGGERRVRSKDSITARARFCLAASRSRRRPITVSSAIGTNLASTHDVEVAQRSARARHVFGTMRIESPNIGSWSDWQRPQAARNDNMAASFQASDSSNRVHWACSIRAESPRIITETNPAARRGSMGTYSNAISRNAQAVFPELFLLFGKMDHQASFQGQGENACLRSKPTPGYGDGQRYD